MRVRLVPFCLVQRQCPHFISMRGSGTYTTIWRRPRSGLRMNLRVRKVTWESAMLERCRSARGQQAALQGHGYFAWAIPEMNRSCSVSRVVGFAVAAGCSSMLEVRKVAEQCGRLSELGAISASGLVTPPTVLHCAVCFGTCVTTSVGHANRASFT
jgi:hypothetical protein